MKRKTDTYKCMLCNNRIKHCLWCEKNKIVIKFTSDRKLDKRRQISYSFDVYGLSERFQPFGYYKQSSHHPKRHIYLESTSYDET